MLTSAVLVLASVPPINLLAEERKETLQLRKELICLTNLQKIARAKEAIHLHHPGDEDEGAQWVYGARRQRGPVEIESGPAAAVLHLGRTWLPVSFEGEIFSFLPWLARLVGLPNGRVAADGSPERTDDVRVVRDKCFVLLITRKFISIFMGLLRYKSSYICTLLHIYNMPFIHIQCTKDQSITTRSTDQFCTYVSLFRVSFRIF